jgi:hypothetical protein
VRALYAVVFLIGACAPPDGAAGDLGARDLPAPAGVTLTAGAASRPLAAYYSIYVAPLSETGGQQVELLVTLIDPAYVCGAPTAGLDAVTLSFLARLPGVDASGVFSRSGPTLGGTSAATGTAQLTAVDDRFEGADGGAIFVGAGGSAAGEVHYQLGPGLRIDGAFTAPHCPALDFAAAA